MWASEGEPGPTAHCTRASPSARAPAQSERRYRRGEPSLGSDTGRQGRCGSCAGERRPIAAVRTSAAPLAAPRRRREAPHCRPCSSGAGSAKDVGARPCPHLRRDWARSVPHLRRDWARPAHICAGTGLAPCHICAGTGLAPAHICTGTGLTPAHICAGTGLTHPADICSGIVRSWFGSRSSQHGSRDWHPILQRGIPCNTVWDPTRHGIPCDMVSRAARVGTFAAPSHGAEIGIHCLTYLEYHRACA
jgi:hypothetical protein